MDVQTEPRFVVGRPTELFRGPYELDPAPDRSYDVAPDGSRFYMLQADPAATPELRVVIGWAEGLKAQRRR